jgi:hypothetical protein
MHKIFIKRRIIMKKWTIGILIFGVFLLFSCAEKGTKEKQKNGILKTARTPYKDFPGSHSTHWKLKASKPILIGKYGDNFDYNGDNVRRIEGTATVDVNVEKDMGTAEVVVDGIFNPETEKEIRGQIKIVYTFTPMKGAPHREGGIADFVFLHGDSGQEPPVLPEVHAYVAGWGKTDIYVSGELLYKDLAGHFMLTEGVRDEETFAVYATPDKEEFYSFDNPGKSFIADPKARQLHFVAHSHEKDPNNFPPNTFWIHINFLEVEDMSK